MMVANVGLDFPLLFVPRDKIIDFGKKNWLETSKTGGKIESLFEVEEYKYRRVKQMDRNTLFFTFYCYKLCKIILIISLYCCNTHWLKCLMKKIKEISSFRNIRVEKEKRKSWFNTGIVVWIFFYYYSTT